MDARTTVAETPLSTATGGPVQMPIRRGFVNVSPINRRRWENFKRNRRGYWALWVFLVLFLVSLFAEFIANDKPFLILMNGRAYFPALSCTPSLPVRS